MKPYITRKMIKNKMDWLEESMSKCICDKKVKFQNEKDKFQIIDMIKIYFADKFCRFG